MLLSYGWKYFVTSGLLSTITAIIMRAYEYEILANKVKRTTALLGSFLLLLIFLAFIDERIILLPAMIAILFRFFFSNQLSKLVRKNDGFIAPSDFRCCDADNEKYDRVKRVIDLVFGVFLFIFLLPVMILLGLLILFTSGKPIIIKQERIGKDEKTFGMYKFRTFTNSDHNKKVTHIGKIIRPLRLDELPQIFNVIKGDMSIVGPRPELKEFHEMAKEHIPNYICRLKVKPGITGWAQINYKYTTTLEEYRIKTSYDLFYVKNRSCILDFKCVMKTPFTILEEFIEAVKKHIKL
ncbi:hypothetical protein IX53_02775 [Kosmotoga pacifica]|uniref:Bacterial sugar transferase domain-containing protein n=2 Tax=Kosmotoga pacifica TaxID=1330330 RepID=A0A0G2ZDU8_9BACT|nr:hypothetical protein IX53_02775 [Kosmotoga pacifica]